MKGFTIISKHGKAFCSITQTGNTTPISITNNGNPCQNIFG